MPTGESRIVPIILAAGASKRLGFPKALARFGERTALQIAVENCARLASPIVVLGCSATQIRRYVSPQAHVIVNRKWRSGQLSSLLAALQHLPRDDAFMLYPVDYPMVTEREISKLIAEYRARTGSEMIVVPSYRRRGGHPVIFAPEVKQEFQRVETAREVVYRDETRVKFVMVNTPAIWQDIDTPASYRSRLREYRRRLRDSDSCKEPQRCQATPLSGTDA